MATIADHLTEAREAYHALLIGKSAVSFRDSNGEEVTYSRASIGRLSGYIRELERQLIGGRPILSIQFRTSKGL